jgi:arginase family enzyme
MSGASLIAHLCRTSDRTAGHARGVEALAPLAGKRLGIEPRRIGEPGDPVDGHFADDLRDSRGCLLEAGGQVDDALSGGRAPVLLAGDCSVCVTTLPAVMRNRPDAKILWLDAHGDFNTPDTTGSNFLGGMCLAAACGYWTSGLADPIPADRVVMAGVRDLDKEERTILESSPVTVIGASLETLVYTQNALDRSPVFVHLDFDVIDPVAMPALIPADNGLAPEKLYDLLEAVAGECEIVGFETTAFMAPEDPDERAALADVAFHVMEPLLDAVAARSPA